MLVGGYKGIKYQLLLNLIMNYKKLVYAFCTKQLY